MEKKSDSGAGGFLASGFFPSVINEFGLGFLDFGWACDSYFVDHLGRPLVCSMPSAHTSLKAAIPDSLFKKMLARARSSMLTGLSLVRNATLLKMRDGLRSSSASRNHDVVRNKTNYDFSFSFSNCKMGLNRFQKRLVDGAIAENLGKVG